MTAKIVDGLKQYAQDMIDGKTIANEYRIKAAKRLLRVLDDPRYEFKPQPAQFVIQIIETTFVHIKGPARGKPYLLEPWQKFCAANLAGGYYKGPNERPYRGAFLFLPPLRLLTF